MDVLTTRINIANLRNVLNAAEALQDAGETEMAQDCLRSLARCINEQMRREPVAPPPEPPMWKSA